MYKLFWAEGTASFAPHAVLEEAGVAYELAVVDFAAGEQRSPAYLAVNPLGKVPALVLPDGGVLTEAAAICLFLGERLQLTHLVPALDDPLRGRFLQDLFYLSTTLQEAYKRVYYPRRFSSDPADAPRIQARAREALMECWQAVERHLAAEGPFHLGDRFSLLDLYTTMLATWFTPQDELFGACPGVAACHREVAQRPAVARCLSRQRQVSVGTS